MEAFSMQDSRCVLSCAFCKFYSLNADLLRRFADGPLIIWNRFAAGPADSESKCIVIFVLSSNAQYTLHKQPVCGGYKKNAR